MILFVGDIHGNVQAVDAIDRYAIKVGAAAVMNVGDFGLLWTPDPIKRFFDKRERQSSGIFGRRAKPGATRHPGPTWYTCGGNHDQYDIWLAKAAETPTDQPLVELAPRCFYVKRGSIVTIDGLRHAVLGGAESVDQHLRIEGKSWWRAETPSREDFDRFYDALSQRPDVVVTHDCPLETSTFDHGDRENQTTPRTLQRIVDLLDVPRPKTWFFGHHHELTRFEVGPTSYFCCGLEGQGYAFDGVEARPFEAIKPARWHRSGSGLLP